MKNWQTIRLGNVCRKIGSGATPRGGSDTYLEAGQFSLIRSQNVYNNRFTNDGLAFISKEQADDLSNVEVSAGDVLLNITGDSVARCCQAPKEVLPARVNQHVAIIRPNPDELNSTFLRYFLVSPQMQEQMLTLAGVGATRNALTKGMIENFDVPKPDITEQRAIASVLGALDDKIELNRRMNETLEALAQSLFKSWFVDATQSALPKGWRETKWSELVTLEYGKSLSDYAGDTGAYPVYGTNGRIGSHSAALCNHPGIVVGRKGAYRGVHYCSSPFFVIDTAFYVEPKSQIELRWAYYELLRLDINGMDSGSAIPSTSRADFYNLPVILPPFELQQRFVEMLGPCWARQEQNEKESRILAALRDALLPKLLSGELRVPVSLQEKEAS